jgi:hypothetical protein
VKVLVHQVGEQEAEEVQRDLRLNHAAGAANDAVEQALHFLQLQMIASVKSDALVLLLDARVLKAVRAIIALQIAHARRH